MNREDLNREDKINEILASIDASAEEGWCSNWAEVETIGTTLIVTLADQSKRRYSIPAV